MSEVESAEVVDSTIYYDEEFSTPSIKEGMLVCHEKMMRMYGKC